MAGVKKTVAEYNKRLTKFEKENPNVVIKPKHYTFYRINKEIQLGKKTGRTKQEILAELDAFKEDTKVITLPNAKGVTMTQYEFDLYTNRKNKRRGRRSNNSLLNKSSDSEYKIQQILKKEEYYNSAVYQTQKIENYKQQYLNQIDIIMGERGKAIKEIVSALPSDVVYGNYSEDEFLQIQYITDPVDVDTLINNIKNAWLALIEDKYSTGEVESKLLKKYQDGYDKYDSKGNEKENPYKWLEDMDDMNYSEWDGLI